MIIFTNNNSTKFCEITLHKNLLIKEKWFHFFCHTAYSAKIKN